MQPSLPSGRQPGPTLYRYVFPEALWPTLFALIGFTVVVLTRDFMQLSELVINRGLGTGTVLRLALLKSVPLAAEMFPFSVLLGCLVALGRLGADREILALESLGISGSRLIWPVLAFAAAMTALAVPFSAFVGPWASRGVDATFEEISRAKPWAAVRAGVRSSFGGWQLLAVGVSPEGKRLDGVLLWMPRLGETVFAERGELGAGPDGAIQISVGPGATVLSNPDGPRYLSFERLSTELPESDRPVRRPKGDDLRSLSFRELAAEARDFVPSSYERVPTAALALHRRIALPATTLVFGFLAAPLFFARRSYSRSAGGVLGLVCTGAYYGLVQLGDGLAGREELSPATAAWMPAGVLLMLGLVLFFLARARAVLGLGFEGGRRESRWSFESLRRASHRGSGGSPGRRRGGPRIKRWPLPRYVAGRFVEIALLSFGALLTAYLVIDVMERLSWFARYEATGSEAIRFYATRIPTLAARVIPMALLVSTALLVSLLAIDGELIGMRACGIPAGRAMVPALLITALVAPGYFVFKNILVPRAYAYGEAIKETEIKAEHLARQKLLAPFWIFSGTRVIEARRFDATRGHAEDVTIYELDRRGLPTRRTDARGARHIGRGVWRLSAPSSVEVSSNGLEVVEPRRFEELGEGLRTEVDTRELSIAELDAEIDEIEKSGLDATIYRIDFHVRFAEALSCVLLPAVALFFAVSGPPFPGPAQNLLVSGVLGVGYILLTSVGASLAQRGAVYPFVGGWGPALFFGALAAFFGARVMRRL